MGRAVDCWGKEFDQCRVSPNVKMLLTASTINTSQARQTSPELTVATAARHAQLLLRQGDAAAAAAVLAQRGLGTDPQLLVVYREVALEVLGARQSTRDPHAEQDIRCVWFGRGCRRVWKGSKKLPACSSMTLDATTPPGQDRDAHAAAADGTVFSSFVKEAGARTSTTPHPKHSSPPPPSCNHRPPSLLPP